MSDPAFDPIEAVGRMKVRTGQAEPPVAAGGAPEPPPAAPPEPTPAERQRSRREAALALVAAYREARPGDPRTDDQLLVAPYGGYELLDRPEGLRPLLFERLASTGPRPEEEPKSAS